MITTQHYYTTLMSLLFIINTAIGFEFNHSTHDQTIRHKNGDLLPSPLRSPHPVIRNYSDPLDFTGVPIQPDFSEQSICFNPASLDLQHAIINQDLDGVKRAIQNGASLNSIILFRIPGTTGPITRSHLPLFEAVLKNNHEIISYLIKMGASPLKIDTFQSCKTSIYLHAVILDKIDPRIGNVSSSREQCIRNALRSLYGIGQPNKNKKGSLSVRFMR